ncbi:tRNA (adenosine(37)-N6)-dimethylallyltransferase MiaA [Porphyromonas levii]|uniref:tRNA (adenosine(37)-N6)-dimethylallyltransferase MiaA n=1 Tax=Porphyromonas levii TaxID=28114 RepID=UPI001BA88E9D|nr:tRNA (adenosine(37)-N6)-dimethylallyltransferase MiaA [Porphyromonas levii]MBR8703450.1 tRNA dimethylallyltransferase [Porphyromonas levii]
MGKLIVVIGATGVGKSAYALQLARQYHTHIISADSRQVYRGMEIGTDAPSLEERALVPHHFIQSRDVEYPYSASEWATEALGLIENLMQHYPTLVMVGGSMMYLQAFLYGMDDVPAPEPEVREALWRLFEEEGVEPLRADLLKVDPQYLERIDANNHKRIIRALEVWQTTGRPFSSYHTTPEAKTFPFEVELHLVDRPRQELYRRINSRVALMVERGLVDEVQALHPYRHLNALNTIGYKEIFAYLDGNITLEQAGQQIAKNSRVYARQQSNFFARWCTPNSPFQYHIIHP